MADVTFPFDPDWVIAPGATIKECMDSYGITVRIGAKLAMIDQETFEGVLAGETPITPQIARGLYAVTLVRASFWLALEHNFRVGLAAGKTWVKQMPFVTDKSGVELARSVRVRGDDGREGKVLATMSGHALVLWDGAEIDEWVEGRTLWVTDMIVAARRRRRRR